MPKERVEIEKKLAYLLKNEFTTSGKIKVLRIAYYQATNEEYFKRISNKNDEKAIKKALRYRKDLDDIILLLDLIKEEKETKTKMVFDLIPSGTFDEKEFLVLVDFFYDLIMDDDSIHDIYLDELIILREKAFEKGYLGIIDIACLDSLIVQGYGKGRYYFRARKYASEAMQIIDEYQVDKDNYVVICHLLTELAIFYLQVRDILTCAYCYKKSSEINLAFNDVDASSYDLGMAYHYFNQLPNGQDYLKSDEEIKKIYGKYAERILQKNRKSSLIVDPIEHTQEFLSLFDEVMEEVEAMIDQEGDYHLCYQRWNYMAESYYRRGIVWRNPKQMNPQIMFD